MTDEQPRASERPGAGVPAWVPELLRESRTGHLGTVGADGQPLVVPVCFAFDGERLYSAIDAKPKRTTRLRRLRNIGENPRVSLVVDRYDEDWTALQWVVVEGMAEILTTGSEFARAIDLLVTKYPQYRALGLARDSGALIRITPARLLHWRAA